MEDLIRGGYFEGSEVFISLLGYIQVFFFLSMSLKFIIWYFAVINLQYKHPKGINLIYHIQFGLYILIHFNKVYFVCTLNLSQVEICCIKQIYLSHYNIRNAFFELEVLNSIGNLSRFWLQGRDEEKSSLMKSRPWPWRSL